MQFANFVRRSTIAILCTVIAAFGLALASPAASAQPITPEHATVAIASSFESGFKHDAAFNPAGCRGLIGAAKHMYVAAFVLGYCPSIVVLQTTSWGRSFINKIVNGACRVPAIVRAATGGKYSTC